MTITKNTISQYFKNLEKYGLKVCNFQNNRPMRRSVRYIPDLMIVGHRCNGDLHFVEIKVRRDKLSDGQKKMLEMLSYSAHTYIATEQNYTEIFDKILGG